MDSRYEHTRKRQPVQFLDQIKDEFGMNARPAVRQNLPVADIGRDNDRTRENAAHLREPIEVFQRTSPNDYALRSVIQRALNELPAAYSSPQLHLDVGGFKNGLNFGLIIPPSRNRIQVDEMKVPKAVLPPG
jgi:hypothetical protein